jgi:hypothetical protein
VGYIGRGRRKAKVKRLVMQDFRVASEEGGK